LESYDSPQCFGYSYGFSKHLRTDSAELLGAMMGRFIVRSNANRGTVGTVTLTWSLL